MVLANRAWLAATVNAVANSSFAVPAVPVAPAFNATPPHHAWPAKACYQNGGGGGGAAAGAAVLFCDDFDAPLGAVAAGLWQWQRNQTTYNAPAPWNTTYVEAWGGETYGAPYQGNGYAVTAA
jgi:hypothetical protein